MRGMLILAAALCAGCTVAVNGNQAAIEDHTYRVSRLEKEVDGMSKWSLQVEAALKQLAEKQAAEKQAAAEKSKDAKDSK